MNRGDTTLARQLGPVDAAVVGTSIGLSCAWTHTDGLVPAGTLNLFQDVLPSLLVGIVQAFCKNLIDDLIFA